MGKRYLVLGAGLQGEAIAHYLYHRAKAEDVEVIDIDPKKRDALAKKFGTPMGEICCTTNLNWKGIRCCTANLTDFEDNNSRKLAIELMKPADAIVSALPYDYNYELAKLAVEAGTHFCDLGGNNTIVDKEFSLHEEAEAKGVKIIPDCGIAPGAVSIVAAHGIEKLGGVDNVDYVKIRVGGLPQHPQGDLKYMIVFSVHGLINEYIEPTEILIEGERAIVESMMGVEELEFPQPYGKMEAAYTSGGSSTLTKTLERKVKYLDYKTIRYPGHWEKIVKMHEDGLFSGDKRAETEKRLQEELTYEDEDCLLMRVTVGNEKEERVFEMIDLYDSELQHSAMQRTTGYSAAIVAQMMAEDIITDTGALHQEFSVPTQKFIDMWKDCGLHMSQTLRSKKVKSGR